MKKRVLAFLMCVVMLLAGLPVSPLADYTGFAVEASAAAQVLGRVEISEILLNVYQGRTGNLTATAYDTNGEVISSGVTYSWASADSTIARVSSASGSSSCVVTGVTKDKNVRIYVTASYGSKTVTENCIVSVSAFNPVTTLACGMPATFNMIERATQRVTVNVAPDNASIMRLNWTSSNENVLKITQSGVDKSNAGGEAYATIQAVREGVATVTYTTTDGSNKSGSFTVNVKPIITSLNLAPYVVLRTTSSNTKVSYTILPADAGIQVLNWSSNAASVCTVSSSGVLAPKAVGKCTVTARTTDGSNLSDETLVVVSDGTSTISLNRSTCLTKVGDADVDLTATCTLSNGTVYQDAANWRSSNTSVVSVNSLGVVKAIGPGTATVTATTLDGSGKSASCTFTVIQPVKGISLPDSAVCEKGKTCTITPSITPSNASNKNITWTSSNTAVATVSSTGVVTGKTVGSARITARTADGGYTDTCTVNVEIMPTGVTLSDASATLHVSSAGTGTSKTLTATVSPANTTTKTVTWSSSNPAVATVNSNGKVTAVAGGTAVITCTTQRAKRTASCRITVTQDESGVEILNIPSSFYVGKSHTLTARVLPATSTNKAVTWSSSNSSVVKVSSDGVIEGMKAGTARITVRTNNKGKSSSVSITVNSKVNVTGVTLNKSKATLKNNTGKTLSLIATVSPNNASDKSIVWTSSNKKVAKVSSSGVVTPKSAGTAVITARTVDGNYTATCKVKVKEPVTGVQLSSTSMRISAGQAKGITATVLPANATNKSVTWTSSNTDVATVNSSGLVTAKNTAGTTVITATTVDGKFYASCTVTVVLSVTSIKLNSTNLTLPKGEKRAITAIITPSNATNQGVTWKSSDTSIATVSSTGVVRGIATGSAIITATARDGGHTAELDVRVIQPATSVTLVFSSITLDTGRTKTLTATVKPLTATDKTVVWKSSNKKVAKVSSNGLVTAVGAGTATITCTSADGYAKATCKVTVNQPVTGIKFASKKANVKIGTPKTLKVTVTPESASNQRLIWSSSNEKVATVSSGGVVTGIKKGTAKITVTTGNGLFSAVITVNVQVPVKKVSLNKTSVTINVGKTTVITPIIKPASAANKNVTWKSSNNDVVTVSADGKVTAKAPGYAVVTCITKDGKKTAKCQILVNQPVTSVKINKTEVTVDINKTLTLRAGVRPTTASNKTIRWSSSNKNVVKVTSKGVLKPVAPGKATITVTSDDGSYTAQCKVTVVREVKSVSLKPAVTAYIGQTKVLKASITPSNATNRKVTWTSSNKKVATVSSKGVITPKKPGKATITVTTVDGGHKATCTVTVRRGIEFLKINKTKLTLDAGKTYSLKITKKPENATEKITWTSSNKKVATVSKSGVITAKARGTATITGVTEQKIKVTCKVTVNQPVLSMKINKTAATVYIGDTLTISAGVRPKNANDQTVIWSTSDKSVATVKDGKITPRKPGTVTITATSNNGKTASCTVTVKRHVDSVKLDRTTLTLEKGATYTVVPTVRPSTATEKGCKFSSSDTSVATVSADGVITAKAAGTAEITVTAKDNGITAKITVTVTDTEAATTAVSSETV